MPHVATIQKTSVLSEYGVSKSSVTCLLVSIASCHQLFILRRNLVDEGQIAGHTWKVKSLLPGDYQQLPLTPSPTSLMRRGMMNEFIIDDEDLGDLLEVGGG